MTQISLRLVDDGAHTPAPEPPTAIAPNPAERPAPNVPAQAKPLVTVRIRPEDGRPDVTVTGGDARIRIVD